MHECDAIELIGFLVHSKAIWKNPELLKLVEDSPNPTQAHKNVFIKTGSKRKAKAAHWYACAIRDHGDESLGTLVAVLRLPQGEKKLEELLTSSTSLEMGKECKNE